MNMLYTVLTAVMHSRDVKALVNRYEETKDGHAPYVLARRVLETEFHDSCGLSTRIKNINFRTSCFLGKQDPQPFFDYMRSNYVRFNRMSLDDPHDSMTISPIAVYAMNDNLLNDMFVVLQRDLNDVG